MGRMKDLQIDLDNIDLTSIGGRIEWARKRQGMTQDDLSKAMPRKGRKSRASIALYEKDKPVSLAVLENIAKALNVQAGFLAFGDEADAASAAPEGQRVPVDRQDFEPDAVPEAILPRRILAAFDAVGKELELVRLAVDAPSFGVRSGEYLLLDVSSPDISADGSFYAVESSAGVALVRSEPIIAQDGRSMHLTGGQGTNYNAPSESIKLVGRLIASVQKRG